LSAGTKCYYVYGAMVRSDWPLPCPERNGTSRADVHLIAATAAQWDRIRHAAGFANPFANPKEWFERKTLSDGSTFLRWLGLYEFLVSSDGRRILAPPPKRSETEQFLVYLLNGALPVALLRFGLDPLHATAAVVDGKAVAFLGRSGYGKSTLGAAFLDAGFPILTDDLLVIQQAPAQLGRYMAHPGPPRLKLLPEAASRFSRQRTRGIPMNPQTNKLVFRLRDGESLHEAAVLQACYVLNAPPTPARTRAAQGKQVRIRRLQGRQALLALIRNSYNDWLTDPSRLSNQIGQYALLASQVPVKLLSYPRHMDLLGCVRDAVIADLKRQPVHRA
jgi:hypothetical protein